MLRSDINEAITQTPPNIQADLGGAAECLEMLNAHLSENEAVAMISSAAVRGMDNAPLNCVLALTNRRVIFVAPRPQAIALPLRAITRFQVVYGTPAYLFLEGAGAEYSLGIDNSWGDEVEKRVHPAVAAAIIADE